LSVEGETPAISLASLSEIRFSWSPESEEFIEPI
jgi:hypothetical protein